MCEASQQPADRISASDCPFCKDWEIKLRRENPNIPIDETIVVSPAQFRHHVGSHMQQLALFAIPRGYLEEETVDVNSAASVAVAGTAARDSSKSCSALGSFKTVTASAHSYPSSGMEEEGFLLSRSSAARNSLEGVEGKSARIIPSYAYLFPSMGEGGFPPSQSSAAQNPSEGVEGKLARTHSLYQAQPKEEDFYHCPNEGQPGCTHKPTKLKCNYE